MDIKYTEYYYRQYKNRATRRATFIKGFLAICSAASIGSWAIWNELQIVWMIILAVSQILNAIQFLFPYQTQISTMNFFIPELCSLLNRIEHDWDKVRGHTATALNDDQISLLILEYDNEFYTLENKYIGNTYMPYSNSCKKKAIKYRDDFCKARYPNNNGKDVLNVPDIKV
jgi:hypothetical protein